MFYHDANSEFEEESYDHRCSCMRYLSVLHVGLSLWKLIITMSALLLCTLAKVTSLYRTLSITSTVSLLVVSKDVIVMQILIKLKSDLIWQWIDLAEKGEKMSSISTNTTQYTVLLGVTMTQERCTPLVVFK